MCSLKLREEGLTYRDWGRMGTNTEDPSERFGHSVDGIDYDYKFLYGLCVCVCVDICFCYALQLRVGTGKIGYNFKASEMNAAFGIVQMQKLPLFTELRRANIDRFIANMKDTAFILPDDSPAFDPSTNWVRAVRGFMVECLWLTAFYCRQLAWPMLVPPQWQRKEVLNWIESNGIQTRVFFAGNICRHPVR